MQPASSIDTDSDVGRTLLTTFRSEVKQLFASFPSLPISDEDVFSGRSWNLAGIIDNSSDVMIPIRRLSHELGKKFKEAAKILLSVPEELKIVEGYADDLTNLVVERHDLGNPKIIQVTKESVSPVFLENLKRAEKVHKIKDDQDLNVRMNHPRRAIYAWPDPYDPNHALISVQVAYTKGMAKNIHHIIEATDYGRNPDTAVPYSISNWFRIGGVGKPFLYGIVEHIEKHGDPSITQVATLSPMSGFRAEVLKSFYQVPKDKTILRTLAAQYVLTPTKIDGATTLLDPVARFHVWENGAEVAAIREDANPADEKALKFMACYKYYDKRQPVDWAKNLRTINESNRPACTPEIDRLLNANIY